MARGDYDDDTDAGDGPLADRLLAALRLRHGVATSAQLQQALGKSQATLSRVLRSLGAEVAVLGRQRSARYALVQPLLGRPGVQPLWWTDEHGIDTEFGTLTHLGDGRLHVEAAGIDITATGNGLPWFLAPLRLQGFLGRQWARSPAAAGFDPNPERWRIDQVLLLLLTDVRDLPGAIWPGEPADELSADAPAGDDALTAHFDALADAAGRQLPAGSSAAGEQPKFLAGNATTGRHWLVKFSPPRDTPFGQRWHDLLHAEALALAVLAGHGVPVAQARVLHGARRTHLASLRFDRVGARGRRHVVPLDAVHDAFVPGPRRHWAATVAVLERQRRVPAESAVQVAAIHAFGHLIGNTDMHFGNLALQVDGPEAVARGRFTLAPVYDMLPMRWRPDAHIGAPDLAPFEPDGAALASGARPVARRFWEQAQALADLSPGFRQLAGAMARRLAG